MLKNISILIVIISIAGILRFYNLMHDSPFFFNPDERNMANAVSQFRLPAKLTEIPICLISQLINDPGSLLPKLDPGSSITTCNLNPHFFAYGQFPLYLAFASDQLSKAPISLIGQISQIPDENYLSTTFSSAIFWLRFYSALSSTLTVLLVYLITKQFLHYQAKKWDVRNVKLDNEMGSGKKNLTSHFNNPASHLSLLTSILAAFTPGLIQSAHFGTTESLLAFFFLASVYLSFRLSHSPLSISHLSNLGNLGSILLLSLSIGLALGSKLTGIFFFVPPMITLMIRVFNSPRPPLKLRGGLRGSYWRLVYFGKLGFIGLLIFIGSILIFIVSSPYNLIEPENFKSAVFGYEQDVATGKYEAFYTRQFVNTIPILFQAEKIFPYTLGWPVFILGTLGLLFISSNILLSGSLFILQGIKYYVLRIRYKKVKNKNILNTYYLILTTSFLLYFLPNSSLFAKWTRFMTPILPFFSIFAGYFLFQISKLFRCHSDPPTGGEESLANARPLRQAERSLTSFGITKSVLTFAFLFLAILPGIAFMAIYTHENTRITASKWIYQNIPNNSYVLSETANVVDIPLGLKDTPDKNFQVISFDFYHLDENPTLFNQLLTHLEKANYIFIPSRRIFANYTRFPQKFPLITKYYQLLFSGALGFEKIAEISSFPQLPISQIGQIRLIINDESAEETFTVFDHPVIRIYRKIHQYTPDQYRLLLTTARID